MHACPHALTNTVQCSAQDQLCHTASSVPVAPSDQGLSTGQHSVAACQQARVSERDITSVYWTKTAVEIRHKEDKGHEPFVETFKITVEIQPVNPFITK